MKCQLCGEPTRVGEWTPPNGAYAGQPGIGYWCVCSVFPVAWRLRGVPFVGPTLS